MLVKSTEAECARRVASEVKVVSKAVFVMCSRSCGSSELERKQRSGYETVQVLLQWHRGRCRPRKARRAYVSIGRLYSSLELSFLDRHIKHHILLYTLLRALPVATLHREPYWAAHSSDGRSIPNITRLIAHVSTRFSQTIRA